MDVKKIQAIIAGLNTGFTNLHLKNEAILIGDYGIRINLYQTVDDINRQFKQKCIDVMAFWEETGNLIRFRPYKWH